MQKEITKEVVDKVNELLKENKIKARKYIENYFNVHERTSRRILEKIINEYIDSDSISYSGDSNDLQEVLRQTNVDLAKWDVETYTISKKEIKKVDDFDHVTYGPKYEFNIKLKKKKIDIEEIIKDFVEKANEYAPKVFKQSPLNKGENALLIGVPDAHIGKLAHGASTGHGDFDTNIGMNLYREAIQSLLDRSDLRNVKKIIFPVGNDHWTVDNDRNTTSGNTPQDVDSRYFRTFTKGCQLLVDAIELFASKFEVDVLVVPGNHDETTALLGGEYLKAYFRNNKRVNINNAPTLRKYYKWGTCLFGFTHGNSERHANLGQIMSSECREDWATTTDKRFFLGHYHHIQQNDYFGVNVHFLPSICKPDFWHSKNGFIGAKRGAQSFLFSKTEGLLATYFHYLD